METQSLGCPTRDPDVQRPRGWIEHRQAKPSVPHHPVKHALPYPRRPTKTWKPAPPTRVALFPRISTSVHGPTDACSKNYASSPI